jgi:hypothetical protein
MQNGVGRTGVIRPFVEGDSSDPAILHLCSSVNDLADNLPVFCKRRKL